MRFLRKPDGVAPDFDGLSYGKDTPAIRERLLEVQKRFCAYSEKRFEPLDSIDVEHFDPRLKHTSQDGFPNWYAVVGKINVRRARKIERFLPLPDPGTAHVQARIKFERGEFQPVDELDTEIERLIEYVRANDELTLKHRENHVNQVADLRRWMTAEELEEHLLEQPELLSFPTALQHELGIPAFELIDRVIGG